MKQTNKWSSKKRLYLEDKYEREVPSCVSLVSILLSLGFFFLQWCSFRSFVHSFVRLLELTCQAFILFSDFFLAVDFFFMLNACTIFITRQVRESSANFIHSNVYLIKISAVSFLFFLFYFLPFDSIITCNIYDGCMLQYMFGYIWVSVSNGVKRYICIYIFFSSLLTSIHAFPLPFHCNRFQLLWFSILSYCAF